MRTKNGALGAGKRLLVLREWNHLTGNAQERQTVTPSGDNKKLQEQPLSRVWEVWAFLPPVSVSTGLLCGLCKSQGSEQSRRRGCSNKEVIG